MRKMIIENKKFFYRLCFDTMFKLDVFSIIKN